jgi:hypothetical protein
MKISQSGMGIKTQPRVYEEIKIKEIEYEKNDRRKDSLKGRFF